MTDYEKGIIVDILAAWPVITVVTGVMLCAFMCNSTCDIRGDECRRADEDTSE